MKLFSKYLALTVAFIFLSSGVVINAFRDQYTVYGDAIMWILVPSTMLFLIAVMLNEIVGVRMILLRGRIGVFCALNSFKKFRQNEDIMLDCITSETMEDYEAWHKNRGVAPNTISFYTRILRAVYNRAVEDDIIENRNPFRHVYTGVDKTVKRALPLTVIKKIKALDLSLTPALDFARDMWKRRA